MGGGVGWGGHGRCEQRSEDFVKIQKKKKNVLFVCFWGGGGGGGGGVRVDVNEVLKFLWKFLGGGGGIRVDVNEELKFL